ncbi:hypothetical protein [Pseudomonas zhanjiangensis]|uniref:Plasmid related protein n=1 Tax=Pseudomonas zhanjiangensis TaxID=3239015 RepID=A0ABV3YX51_9PSED
MTKPISMLGSGSRFSPGNIVSTPGALAALREHGKQPCDLLDRHLAGDWGDVCPGDAIRNDQSLAHGERLFSAYEIASGVVVWVITERDRALTTLLLPHEY